MSNDEVKESLVKLQFEAFLTAVQFLTRVPVPGGAMAGGMERYQSALARSVIYFPLVGALVTAASAVVVSLLMPVLPIELVVVTAIAFEALLTGAFHEDALADTCDALGGGWTREQVLEILKDSRLGTYGTLGLGLGVACRYFAIVSLAEQSWYWIGIASLIFSGTLGRWAILWLMHTVAPIADRHSQARDVAGQQTGRAIFVSGLIGLVGVMPWLILDPIGVAISLLASAIVLMIYRWQIVRKVGGSTGDLLGCGCYLVQLTVLVVAAGRCFVSVAA